METSIRAIQTATSPVNGPAASPTVLDGPQQAAGSGLDGPQRAAGSGIDNPAARARLKKAAREFEALLVEHMLKTARTPLPGKPLLGDSAGHDVYQGLADEQFARALSQGRGLGLGDMLYRNLVRTTQKTPSSAASSAPIQKHGETSRPGRAAL